jgi:hypothetical protein
MPLELDDVSLPMPSLIARSRWNPLQVSGRSGDEQVTSRFDSTANRGRSGGVFGFGFRGQYADRRDGEELENLMADLGESRLS